MSNYLIEASGLRKSFGKVVVFENLNFKVEPAEIVAIVGPSGLGKSTFLRCLIGLEKVQAGTIFIDGVCLVDKGIYCKAQTRSEILSKIGMVFQNYELFMNLNVLQNLLIVQNNEPKARQLLSRFGLIEKSDEYISNLSGGQKQRLAIIRALLKKPQIIFFDEPTSALDKLNLKEIVKLIKELQLEGCGSLVVTHDLNLVEQLNCRVFDFKNLA